MCSTNRTATGMWTDAPGMWTGAPGMGAEVPGKREGGTCKAEVAWLLVGSGCTHKGPMSRVVREVQAARRSSTAAAGRHGAMQLGGETAASTLLLTAGGGGLASGGKAPRATLLLPRSGECA